MVKYLILIALLLSKIAMLGQLHCVNYNTKDGLPSENITALIEDEKGYLYVGTATGLSYFDGVNFETVSNSGTGDIPYNVFVEKISMDRLGNVWILTEHNGIYRLEVKTKHWTNFSMYAPEEYRLPTHGFWNIQVVDDKVLVSCGKFGLWVIDTKSLALSRYDKLGDVEYRGINRSWDGKILLTSRKSIIRIENLSDSIKKEVLFNDTKGLDLMSSYETTNGSVYTISYTKGIYRVENGNLKTILPNPELDTWRYNFVGEQNNKLWLVFKNHGIASLDLITNKWVFHESRPFSNATLPKGKYNAGFIDSRDIIWIATSKGLSSINPDLQAFQTYENERPTNEFLMEAIYDKNRNQYLMLYASEKAKVKIFDNDFNERSSFNHTPDVNYVQTLWNPIYYERDFLCLGHHIMKINGTTGHTARANLPGCPTEETPRIIALDDDNNLWIAYLGNRIIQYSVKRKKVIKEFYLPQFNKSAPVNYRLRGMNNCGDYISVAAEDLFFLINRKTYKTEAFDVDMVKQNINKINTYPSVKGSITEVSKRASDFYICTRDEGVYKAKYFTNQSEFSVSSSLTSRDISGPVELVIDNDLVWIASDNGLIVADRDLTIKKRVNAQQGLPKTKLSQGLSLTNGKLILNSGNGIVVGDTSLLKKEYKVWPVDIQKVLVNKAQIDPIKDGIRLGAQEKNIQINVALPIYDSRSFYTYAYRLLPTSTEWSEVKISQGQFRYDNLQSGNYTFQIKSRLGQIESETTQFSFTIVPPYWKQWWFILLILVAIVFLSGLLYRARVRTRVNQEKVKTRLAELQNEAIRAQLNPHFIFNALNSIRSLILMDRKEHSLSYLGRFSTLVREVLSISKEETITLKRELDFNENYVNIERLRFSQSLSYCVNVEDGIEPMNVRVPPLVMQPFIENAIWHGLLGKVNDAVLSVDITKSDEGLMITIDDNGEGRNKTKSRPKSKYKTQKAYGELLSRQRLQSIGDNARINILDKMENGKPTGTKVEIILPLNL